MSTSSPTSTSEFWNYTNSEYHFAFTLPHYVSAPGCDSTAQVKADETQEHMIKIGAYLTGCPDIVNPQAFIGWIIYAANDIATYSEANQFVEKMLGSGCRLNSWRSNSDEENDWIVPASYTESMGQTEQDCPAAMSRTQAMYSRSLDSLLVWSYGQEPAFTSATGDFDGEVSASFHFIGTVPD